MGLGDLLYSIWKSDDKTIDKKNSSIAINQGQHYKSYKSDKIKYLQPSLHLMNDTNGFTNNNYTNIIEGFVGMLGPTQVNVKNRNEAVDHNVMENKFNQSLSEYAGAQKNLMDKTQNYIQTTSSSNQRNVNMYAVQAQRTEDIHPKWKGCYAGGKGLLYQDDMGNSATLAGCKTRASDLGYSQFALTGASAGAGGTGTGAGKCYVGNGTDQDNELSYKPMVSYAFTQNKNATMGGLLKNGQVGTFNDYTSSGLVADLSPVAGCDAEVGGYINAKNSVASYGMNCNAPPAPPVTFIPHLDNTGQHMTWDSSDKYAKSKGGRLATFNELLDYIRQKGGLALVPKEDQWVAVTDGYDGAKRDWEQIGNPGFHTPGKSHIQYYGYPGWGDTLSNAAYNVYVFWMEPASAAQAQASAVPQEMNCGDYGDKDTGLPHKCIQELWNNAGCLTDSGFNEAYWTKNNKKAMIGDMGKWSTMTDDYHRTKCYGTDKTKWPGYKAPAPVPAPVPAHVPAPAPTPASPYHLTQVAGVSWMGSLQYANSQGGRLPTYAEAIAYIQKVGKALVPDFDQWVAVTNGANNEYDWIAINVGAQGAYPIGTSLVGAGGKPVFTAWFNTPSSNNWVLWVS